MGAPRPVTRISGFDASGNAKTFEAKTANRTLHFPVAFALSENTSVTPPRIEVAHAAAPVSSVAGSAPIVSSGGATPTISITAASGAAAGSMSAAHWTKLEGIEAGADVTDFPNVSTALSGASGNISVNSNRITDLSDPADAQDAATKAHVAAVVAAAAIPGGDFAFLPPRMANAGATTRNATGAWTHGISFFVTKACDCIGIEGYWSASGTETVRGELWQHIGSSSLANATVEVSASGIWTVTFASPITLTPYTMYFATQCVSSSTHNTTYTTNSGTTGITNPTAPFYAGNGLWIVSLSRYNSTSNTIPNNTSAGFYPVAPRF